MKARVLKAPAGLGKTRLYAAIIAGDAGRKTWEVYCATMVLAEEFREAILAIDSSVRVQVIRGREQAGPNGVPMCQRSHLAGEVAKAGLPVHQSICKRTDASGGPPDKCPHYDRCAYIQQFARADVYIYTHAHLPLKRGPLEHWWPREVLIDESFVMSMYERVEIAISLLQDPRLPIEASALCQSLAVSLVAGHSIAPLLQAAYSSRPSALNRAIDALLTPSPLDPSARDSTLRKAVKYTKSFRPIALMLAQLKIEIKARGGADLHSVEFDRKKSCVVFHHRRSITRFQGPGYRTPNITILDASADALILSRFFEIEAFDALRLPRKARVIQCSSTRGSTTSFVPSKNSDRASRARATQRLRDIETLVTRLVNEGNRVLVVGPSAVAGNTRTGKHPLIRLPKSATKHVEFAQFNAVRGVDRWKNCDVAVIVGRNEPPVDAVEGIARALWHDDPNRLQLTGEWTTELRGYRMVTGSSGIDTVVLPDARLQAVLEQIRECESVQAIDRLRLIHATTPKLVYVLSSLPLDLDVDELRTWDEIIYGTRLEQSWDRRQGVLPLAPAWLAATHPDLWATEGAAKKDLQRWAAKRGQISNGVSIRNLSPLAYAYKRPSARSWSTCLSTSTEAGQVKAELERLLGEVVQVRQAAAAAASPSHPAAVTSAAPAALPVPRPTAAARPQVPA